MYDACVPWPERPKGAKDKSRGPKGLQLEVGARRAPKLLVFIIWEYIPVPQNFYSFPYFSLLHSLYSWLIRRNCEFDQLCSENLKNDFLDFVITTQNIIFLLRYKSFNVRLSVKISGGFLFSGFSDCWLFIQCCSWHSQGDTPQKKSSNKCLKDKMRK